MIDTEILKNKLIIMYSAYSVDTVHCIDKLMKIKINTEKVLFVQHKETLSDAYNQTVV